VSKYIIDTQLVIRAIRHHDEAEKMDDFLSAFSSSVYLSSVVVQELLAGARDAEMRRLVRRDPTDLSAGELHPARGRQWREPNGERGSWPLTVCTK
jgi:predicted nucleic acid-binding protein